MEIFQGKFKLFLNNSDDGIADLRYDIGSEQIRLTLKPIIGFKGIMMFASESEQNKKYSIEIEQE